MVQFFFKYFNLPVVIAFGAGDKIHLCTMAAHVQPVCVPCHTSVVSTDGRGSGDLEWFGSAPSFKTVDSKTTMCQLEVYVGAFLGRFFVPV